MSLVCTLSGWCSGISGEASFREKRLTLAERGRKHFLKINDDDDDDDDHHHHHHHQLLKCPLFS